MSDLKFQEIKKIHAFLSHRGYFISHRELDTLFKQHQLDKYDDLDPNLVAYEGGLRSKYDRLTAFFTDWLRIIELIQALASLLYFSPYSVDLIEYFWQRILNFNLASNSFFS